LPVGCFQYLGVIDDAVENNGGIFNAFAQPI
jgi:hypothetical protein